MRNSSSRACLRGRWPTVLDQLTASVLRESLTVTSILTCSLASVLLGLGIAGVYMVKNQYSKGMVATLALLPAIVQMVIMMVNGNIGTGVAVAGAFSLVRFRSLPGTSRDIVSIFFAMAIGLATGMGYLFYAFVFFLLIALFTILLFLSPLGERRGETQLLKVTIPEDLDYETIFDDLFSAHTRHAKLQQIKTSNMGSLYDLRYEIVLTNPSRSKELLDAMRCRNGNLSISLGRPVGEKEGL